MPMFAVVQRCGGHTCPPTGCVDEAEEEVHRSATAARTGRHPSAPAIVRDVVSSPGSPMPARLRHSMGKRFGYDFDSVRIHTNSRAANSARAVAAKAYAVGPHVVFAADAYRPESPEGERLLAHELAHVVQQPVPPTPSTPLIVSDPADASEREAAAHSHAPALAAPLHGSAKVARQDAGTGTATTHLSTPPAPPMTKEQKDALTLAKALETKYPGWRAVLPHCPCTDKAARASADWSGPDACGPKYHPGAATGYRSTKGYKSVPGTNHGQQCCYDAMGLLITDGAAAGTPDVVQAPSGAGSAIIGTWPWSDRPGLGAALEHKKIDVVPFEELGWETYNQYWIPDRGVGCAANKKP
jgi:Domain of unknown function (DUF4157)/AMOP domain